MKSQGGYVPPPYIPLGQSDPEEETITNKEERQTPHHTNNVLPRWSSGICACCDDFQSCCIGFCCPCFLFGKNAEVLGSGTTIGSCITHSVLLAFVNSLCCLFTGGILLCFPGCSVACYACGYRKALRSRYNLPEAPCGDFVTHLCCHWCALCQEYREIRERSGDSNPPEPKLVVLTAPAVQKMGIKS